MQTVVYERVCHEYRFEIQMVAVCAPNEFIVRWIQAKRCTYRNNNNNNNTVCTSALVYDSLCVCVYKRDVFEPLEATRGDVYTYMCSRLQYRARLNLSSTMKHPKLNKRTLYYYYII